MRPGARLNPGPGPPPPRRRRPRISTEGRGGPPRSPCPPGSRLSRGCGGGAPGRRGRLLSARRREEGRPARPGEAGPVPGTLGRRCKQAHSHRGGGEARGPRNPPPKWREPGGCPAAVRGQRGRGGSDRGGELLPVVSLRRRRLEGNSRLAGGSLSVVIAGIRLGTTVFNPRSHRRQECGRFFAVSGSSEYGASPGRGGSLGKLARSCSRTL